MGLQNKKTIIFIQSPKKLLNNFNFKVIKKQVQLSFSQEKYIFLFLVYSDLLLQKILDFKVIPFLINFSDNIVILGKKKNWWKK